MNDSIAALSTSLAASTVSLGTNVTILHASEQVDKIVGQVLANSIGLGNHIDTYA
jgi:hypothetical protein